MRALVIFLALFAGSLAVHAADQADRASIRAVIGRQLEAFKRDDAVAAYALAAPGIRKLFPDEGTFLTMVQKSYPAVFRPKDVLFGEFSDDDASPIQAVRLTDEDGETWLALYTLEKQPDGTWLIAGCVLVKQRSERV